MVMAQSNLFLWPPCLESLPLAFEFGGKCHISFFLILF
jgi:hypothetical protein